MTPIVERLSAALSDRYRIERQLGQGGMAISPQPTAGSRRRPPGFVRRTESDV